MCVWEGCRGCYILLLCGLWEYHKPVEGPLGIVGAHGRRLAPGRVLGTFPVSVVSAAYLEASSAVAKREPRSPGSC